MAIQHPSPFEHPGPRLGSARAARCMALTPPAARRCGGDWQVAPAEDGGAAACRAARCSQRLRDSHHRCTRVPVFLSSFLGSFIHEKAWFTYAPSPSANDHFSCPQVLPQQPSVEPLCTRLRASGWARRYCNPPHVLAGSVPRCWWWTRCAPAGHHQRLYLLPYCQHVDFVRGPTLTLDSSRAATGLHAEGELLQHPGRLGEAC